MQKTYANKNRRNQRIIVALTLFSSSGLLALLGFATPSSPTPYSRPGVTVMMLAANAGSTKSSSPVAVSADGRYLAFSGGFPFGCCVVGVYDRQTGVTDTPAGSTGDGTLALSGDGRYLAYSKPFYTSQDVFVHDRQTGTDTAISVAPDGSPPTCSSPGCVFSSWYPSISADGRYVSFASFATNLVAGDTQSANNADVFVHDMQTGTTQRVSVASDGTQANGMSYENSISADGRYVAFRSYATNLVTGNTNSGSSATCTLQGQTSTTSDVYVHDRQTGTTELVSVGMNGTQDGCSWSPSISDDGRYVAFVSSATSLVPSDSNSAWDVYVRDRQTGRTERMSVTSDGAQGSCPTAGCRCGAPSISSDGRYAAFHSFAALASDDVNGTGDIYVHDRETGNTERVSLAYPGEQVPGEPPGNANSTSGPNAANGPGISADGRIIVFDSFAADLVQNDNWNNPSKAYTDVFFRDRGNAVGIGALSAACSANPATASGWATFSGGLLVSADDPANDGAPGAPSIGAELIGASIAYRPERADLFVRLPVTALLANVGAAPGILYGLKITVNGIPYEVRATKAEGFALYNCQNSVPSCTQVGTLSGSIGTTGSVVTASVPLNALGANEGSTLSGLDGYTALGTAATGPATMLDDVALSSTTIPIRSVTLGIAPSATAQVDVLFNTTATLANGNFSGSLPPTAAGTYKVWAKACLGNNCGVTSAPLTVGAACAAPPVQLVSIVSRMTHGSAGTFDVDLTNGNGIECRSGGANGNYTIVFNFTNPLSSVTRASVASGTGSVVSNGIDSSDARNYIVNLTGVTNAQYITVSLTNVTDSAGNNSISVPSPSMGVLVGDVNASGRTDNGDAIVVRNLSGTVPTDTSTARADVNCSGRIDNGDAIVIRNNSGNALP
jgi:Tol biopolymer transport system component